MSDINRHEQVVLFPTFGHRSADGRGWKLGISGAVFRRRPAGFRRRVLLRMLRKLLKVPPQDFDSGLFQSRSESFLISTVRGKRIAVRIGNRIVWLQKPSKRNGHFRGSIRLDVDQANELASAGELESSWLRLEVVMPQADIRRVTGRVNLIDEMGVSIISDIDDTIKLSNVANRRELLRNTFLRDFQAVPGMAGLYHQWHQQGAAFHYVSSSPWQLFESLHAFLTDQEFPVGSMHLRQIRLRDPSLLRLFVVRRYSKRRVIGTIVRMFSRRSFVLVGDSGERDIEIYGSIARRFPSQIVSILIRRVEGRAITSQRLARAFRNIPTTKWRFFSDASELMDHAIISKADS